MSLGKFTFVAITGVFVGFSALATNVPVPTPPPNYHPPKVTGNFSIKEGCEEDIEKYCKGKEPGKGLGKCLHANAVHVSPKCRKANPYTINGNHKPKTIKKRTKKPITSTVIRNTIEAKPPSSTPSN